MAGGGSTCLVRALCQHACILV